MSALLALLLLLQDGTDLQSEAATLNAALDQCIETEASAARDSLIGATLAAHVTEQCEEQRLALRAVAVPLMIGRGMTRDAAERFFDGNFPEHVAEVLIEIEADREGR